MTKILGWNFEKSFLKWEKMASRKIFRHFLRANFFMFILLIGNQEHWKGIFVSHKQNDFFQVECKITVFLMGDIEPQHLHLPSNRRRVETQIKVK